MSCDIPKIIHQTAPEDQKKWHPLWFFCQDSWKNNFKSDEYKYVLWNDTDNDLFIKTEFPQYYKLYCDFSNDIILKVDFVRYAILYKFGGIYADMDFFCNMNFYHKLPSNICIVESPASNEIIQNSLMASPPGDKRWLNVMDRCRDFFYLFKLKNPTLNITGSDVIDISGPRLLSRSFDISTIYILPVNLFNPLCDNFRSTEIYTKHYGTGKWGPSSGIRDFTHMKDIDDTLSKLYIDNFSLNDIPKGYIIINIGSSNSNEKIINLNIPLNENTEFFLCKTNYKDTFITKFLDKNTLLVTRTDESCGWGENHNFYINGNTTLNLNI
jgi:mannosyltransferase OCH1-like enzyme